GGGGGAARGGGVLFPTAGRPRGTHGGGRGGRLRLWPGTDRTWKPPQPLNCVSSAVACPRGTWPLTAGPLSASVNVPPVWQPGGVGGGGPVTVSENVPVAVAPAASVTVTVNVEVPVVAGAPGRSPDGGPARPGRGGPGTRGGGGP